MSETKISDKVSHVTPLSELNEMVQYYGKVEHRNTFINCNLPSADDLLTNNWVREGTGLVFHFILLQGQLLSEALKKELEGNQFWQSS